MAIFASKTTRGFYDSSLHSSMPKDAVLIPDDVYESLKGQVLDWSGDVPIAITPESLPHNVLIRRKIIALESQITPRRIREALLSGDHSFIESIESQIAALRNQLA